MDRNTEIYGYKKYQFYSEPIERDKIVINTNVLFFGAGSVLKRLVEKKLQDGNKVFLVAANIEAFKTGLNISRKADKLYFLIDGSVECVRAYATAKEIYGFGELPDYYIKREEQEVFLYEYPDALKAQKYKGKKEFFGLQSRYRASHVEAVTADKLCAFMEEKEKDTVLVLFTADSFLYKGNLANLVSFDRTVRGYAAEKGLKLKYYVPIPVWLKGKKMGHLLSQEDLIPNTADVTEILSSTALLVTNNKEAIKLSCVCGMPGVFYTGRAGIALGESVRCAYTVSEIAAEMKAFLSDLNKREYKRKSLAKLKEFDELYVKEKKAYHTCHRKILLSMDWELIGKYTKFMQYWVLNAQEKGSEIQVLFRTNNLKNFYNRAIELPPELTIFVHTGALMFPEEQWKMIVTGKIPEERNEEIAYGIRQEWTRTIGVQKFDRALLADSTNGFWKQMNHYAPAENIDVVSNSEMLGTISFLFEPGWLKDKVGDSNLLAESQIKGEAYYYLGKKAEQSYFIKKVFSADSFTLCFYDGKNKEFCRNRCILSKQKECPVIVCNILGTGALFDAKLEGIIELPLQAPSMSLLLRCKKFISSSDNGYVMMASFLGIPTLSPNGNVYMTAPVPERMKFMENSFWSSWIWDESIPLPTEDIT